MVANYVSETMGDIRVPPPTIPISNRVLEVIIPTDATQAQLSMIQQLIDYGKNHTVNPVQVIIREIP